MFVSYLPCVLLSLGSSLGTSFLDRSLLRAWPIEPSQLRVRNLSMLGVEFAQPLFSHPMLYWIKYEIFCKHKYFFSVSLNQNSKPATEGYGSTHVWVWSCPFITVDPYVSTYVKTIEAYPCITFTVANQ